MDSLRTLFFITALFIGSALGCGYDCGPRPVSCGRSRTIPVQACGNYPAQHPNYYPAYPQPREIVYVKENNDYGKDYYYDDLKSPLEMLDGQWKELNHRVLTRPLMLPRIEEGSVMELLVGKGRADAYKRGDYSIKDRDNDYCKY